MVSISFPNGLSYRIKGDGSWLQKKFPVNGVVNWTDCNVSRQGLTIIELRETMGYNVECLLSDGRWYEPNSNGGFSLTARERQKEYEEEKAKKKAHKAEKEALKVEAEEKKNKNKKSTKDSNAEQLAAALQEEARKREIEDAIEAAEKARIERELFGADFKALDYKSSIIRILESFMQGKPTEEQALEKLKEVACSGIFYDDIEEWFGKFKEMVRSKPEHIELPNLSDEYVILFPDFESKYPELADAYENLYDGIHADYTSDAGFLNISAKLKNKQIESNSDDFQDLFSELRFSLSKLRNSLVNIEGRARGLYYYDKKLSEYEASKDDSNFFGLGGKKKQNIKITKERIESTRKRLEENLKDLFENFDKSNNYSKKFSDKAKKLLELTGNDFFSTIPTIVSLEGDGLKTAEIIYKKGKKGIEEKVVEAMAAPVMIIGKTLDKIASNKSHVDDNTVIMRKLTLGDLKNLFEII